MRFYFRFSILLFAGFIFACAGAEQPQTPLETLKAYTVAVKKKDLTAMKTLLSDASLKMAADEAKSQNVPLDEIVERETLFSENQKTVEFRNEKIDGDRATIEMKDSYSAWNTVPFVREDGTWKIDKQAAASLMMQDFNQSDKKLDDLINQGKQP